jgi:hypothetical protein
MISDATALDLLAELDAWNPDAGRLARLTALAARIEPEILRALRLHVLEGASVTAEADVWFSNLVQARSVSSITFFDGALPTLRKWCASDRELAVRACREIARVHRTSTDLVKLEERLIVAALDVDPDGAASGEWTEAVDTHLSRVVAAVLADPKRATDLSSWALRALPRLPERARQRGPFWTLLFLATAGRREVAIDLPGPPAAALADVFEDAFRDVPRVGIEVLWQEGAPWLRIAPLGRDGALQVPATRPVVVQARADGWWTPVVLTRDRWTRAPIVGSGTLIRCIDGTQFRIRPRGSRAPSQDQARSLARIIRGGTQVMGFLVAPTLVASVAHVGYTGVGDSVEVLIAGRSYLGTAAWLDRDQDVAILRVEAAELDAQPLPLAARDPSPGSRWLSFLSYGSANVTRVGGVVAGVTSEGRWMLEIDDPQAIQPGSSGAPILVEGSVVGQLVEMQIPERRTLFAVPVRAIADALARLEVGRSPPSEADDWAIVVGVSRYFSFPSLVSLPSAARDARAFAQWLMAPTGGNVPPDRVTVLSSAELSSPVEGTEPTRVTIEKAFETLARRVVLERSWGRRLYIYFSGNAVRADDPSVPPALLPADASELILHPISSGAWVGWFTAAGAFAEIVVVVDCVIADVRAPPFPPLLPARPKQQTEQVRTYCLWSYEELTYEERHTARPSLTSTLLKGLSGSATNPSGQITTEDLSSFLRREMATFPDPPRISWSSLSDPIVLVPARRTVSRASDAMRA